MHAALIAISTALVLAGPQPRPTMSVSSDAVTISNCLVTPTEEDVQVPTQESGVLMELKVREGQQVTAGDLLGQIDDSKVKRAEEVALYRMQAAEVEAKNDVDVRFAKASAKVALAEIEQSEETNRRVPGTVTQSELRKQYLDHRKSELGIEQAEHNFEVSGLKAQIGKAELAAAKLEVERRQIKAPIPGVVARQIAHVGDWLKEGEPVLRLLRMDRLRIEGFLDATGTNGVMPSEVDGKPVTVKVALPRGREEPFQGKITFVSPVVEAGSQFLVKAEVINRQDQEGGHWLLRPGLNADMTIFLKR